MKAETLKDQKCHPENVVKCCSILYKNVITKDIVNDLSFILKLNKIIWDIIVYLELTGEGQAKPGWDLFSRHLAVKCE